jgi:hypothetical protein
MMIRATVEEVINDMTDYVHGIRSNIGQFAPQLLQVYFRS